MAWTSPYDSVWPGWSVDEHRGAGRVGVAEREVWLAGRATLTCELLTPPMASIVCSSSPWMAWR